MFVRVHVCIYVYITYVWILHKWDTVIFLPLTSYVCMYVCCMYVYKIIKALAAQMSHHSNELLSHTRYSFCCYWRWLWGEGHFSLLIKTIVRVPWLVCTYVWRVITASGERRYVDLHPLEERRSDSVGIGPGRERVQADGGQHIPCRHLAVILVAYNIHIHAYIHTYQ